LFLQISIQRLVDEICINKPKQDDTVGKRLEIHHKTAVSDDAPLLVSYVHQKNQTLLR
jgi:hypothetical protein